MGLPRFPTVCFAAGLALILACACPARGEDAPAAPPRFAPVLGAYVQVRFTDQGRNVGEWALRRLKLMVDGGPNDGIRYRVQFIYKTNLQSPTDDRVVLQDAFLVVPAKRLSVKVGQFIPPFGLERFQPDATLLFTERSRVTNQLVVNGNLGSSFSRDRGAEVGLAQGGLALAGSLFQGAGANMPAKGNGPLGVFRCAYGHTGHVGRAPWSARAGLSGSGRRDREMDLRGALPRLDSTLVSRFAGGDRRINGFIEGRVGRWRAQAEFFRAWLSPDQGIAWTARGAYAQVSLLLFAGAEIGTRHEVFTPDVRRSDVPASRQWNVAMTYALPTAPIRLWADYARRNNGSRPLGHEWTLQVQWYAFRGLRLWR